ncbi:ATP-binding protein [Ensifer sp. SSB1]|uniref:ATP-binding protein n=1 Tax=Ensifer sp. SSB1 TaxID=2795385 RepID=UPI001A3775FE|nr:ATP-binding protein [Ensifer sp. SSB1]MBK5571777.1 ATP-binding protein [Ensifer sp. SSB1]
MTAAFKVDKGTRPGTCEKHGAFEEQGVSYFGRPMIWHGCPECGRARADAELAVENEKAERERQAKLETRLQQAGIPMRFRDRTLDSFDAETDGQRIALRKARQFVEDFARHQAAGTTVVFMGAPGTGKSHLAIAIAQAVMVQTTVLYANALDMIRMVRDTWRRDSKMSEREVLEMLGSVGLLVIDEVGVQYGTDGEQVIMFDVINRRYRDLHPTILLSNLDRDGLRAYLGERSFDRLREGGIVVPFDWESYRGRR